MLHDCDRCYTCRRRAEERRQTQREDTIQLVFTLFGVVVVCLCCWILAS